MFKKNKEKKNKDVEVIQSPGRMFIDRFRKNKLAIVGLIMFVIIILLVFGGWLYVELTNYNLANLDHSRAFQPPSWEAPFGTDRSGRNTFIRVLLGGVISLQAGLITVVTVIVLGVTVGGISGFNGGTWIDELLMRIVEIILAIPFLPLAISIQMVLIHLPQTQRLHIMMVIIGVLGIPTLARLVRGQILQLKEQEFMVAARAVGIRPVQQIVRHLLPNIIGFIVIQATISFAGAIMTEATLSFLGLSVSEPIPTWGGLVSRGTVTSIIMRQFWWMWLFPAILLFLLIMSVNLVGEGLRDAVDPKARIKFRVQKDKKKPLFKTKKKEGAVV